MHALRSLQMFEVSYDIECCRVGGEVRSFEHFCNDHAHTCPGNNLVNRNLIYKKRSVELGFKLLNRLSLIYSYYPCVYPVT